MEIEFNDKIIRYIIYHLKSSDGRLLSDIDKIKLLIKFLDDNKLTTTINENE